MPRNYTNGFSAYVTLKSETYTLKYGYKCRLQRDTALGTLGITKIEPAAVTSALMQNFVLGCNSPKPARAAKAFAAATDGHESSFVSTDSMTAARADGWKLSMGVSFRPAVSTDNTQTYYVTINGVKYGWASSRLPSAMATLVDITQVGPKLATKDDTDLVYGCSFPKPPKAVKILNDGADRCETFRDPSVVTLPAGWKPANGRGKSGIYTLEHFKTKV
jgi:hypothetical protein